MTPLLCYDEAARVLGVHPHTVQAYVARGELAAIHLGRRRLILECDLEAFVLARRQGPPATVHLSGITSASPAVWDIGSRGRKGTRSA